MQNDTENFNSNLFSSTLFRYIKNNEVPIIVNIIDPKAPDIVLLGLILVNLGPPTDFPTIYPHISEKIHEIIKIRIISSPNSIFNLIKSEEKKKK